MVTINVPKQSQAPLYHKYPQQFDPQGAYIEIDCKNESVRADWNGEIGNAIPFSVYHGHDRRYSVPSNISWKTLNDIMTSEKFEALCNRIVAGYESEWDGNNHVAVLDDDAQAAEEELSDWLRDIDDQDEVAVWDVADYLYESRRSEVSAETSDADIERMDEEIEQNAGEENVYIDGDVENYYNEYRYELRREKIKEYLDDLRAAEDDDCESAYENLSRDDENPLYEVTRIDPETKLKNIAHVYYDADGKMMDEAQPLKTDFVRAYPEGGSFEIYKTLIAHADGTALRIKSHNPLTNPDKLNVLLRASRDSNWKPFPLVESEAVFDLYLHYGVEYPWHMKNAREDRLRRERDEAIRHYRTGTEIREQKIRENTERQNELRREMQKLEHENITLRAEIDAAADIISTRTREYEQEYQRLLAKGRNKSAA